MAAMLVVMAASLVGCRKPDDVHVTPQDVWFGLEAETQTLDVTANCVWTVNLSDDADWYTVTPLTGKKDGTITISVKAMEEGEDLRATSFVVTSPGGHIRRTVFVSQNRLDFNGMINKIFGVMKLERWNTDYYNEIIEDSYRLWEYNPYDTSQGYLMYYLEGDTGVQRDRHGDHAIYNPFTYAYDPVNHNLHIEFKTIADTLEIYDAEVLTASDSLYRVFHEYKAHCFERADLRKVGTVTAKEMKALLRRSVTRKGGEGIFEVR